MTNMEKITNFQDLMQDYLGDNLVILTYKTSNLTSPGENYGSLMLKVDIRVNNKKTGKEEMIYAVAKTPPPNEFTRKIFNTDVSFKNEIAFYKEIFPLLREFQVKHGMEPMSCYPDFLGARFNLGSGDKIDGNAALVLENLVQKGFVTENRYQGFDYETTKLIVHDLANFHATAIALKLQKPRIFQSKIKPYLDGVVMEQETDTPFALSLLENLSIALDNENIRHLKEKILEMWKSEEVYKVREPWATIAHADLWVNNTMVKFENGKPVENKFVDFQICRYHSPLSDLLFLLLLSVQDSVMKESFDFFLDYYHQEFVATLELLHCDVAPFSKELFEEEIQLTKNEQIKHVLFFMFPVFMDKSHAVEIKDSTEDSPPPFRAPSARHVEKLVVVLELLEKKGWLN